MLRALLLKLLLLGVLVGAADSWPAQAGYVAAREGDANDVVWYLSRGFDANAYQRLAREGYYDDFSRNYPLGYPLLIRAALVFTGNAQTAAVLVSNLASILAVLVFFALARRYSGGRLAAASAAALLFSATPGVLTFGTVAYSEGPYLLFALCAWWAYLRAEGAGGGDAAPVSLSGSRRSLPWLATASLLGGASVFVRHMGAPLFVAWGVLELTRVLAGGQHRRRAVGEALATLWAGLPLGAYFVWKFSAHDLGGLQEEIWQMHFALLGGPASLLRIGVSPEHVTLIYATLPVAILLGARLWRVDRRLVLVAALMFVLVLSFTGVAAQSSTRYVWTIWPLALGALELRDRGVVWALAGLLVFVSVWCGLGHVLGTAAL